MVRGVYFKCENCAQKAYDEFPLTWIHISAFNLQVQKGKWLERDLAYEGANTYQFYSNLSFCCFQCFFDWCVHKYPEACKDINPSQRTL